MITDSQEASEVHGAATHELVGGRRCDGGGRGSSAGLRCLPREEWFEDLLGAPVLLHEACVVKGGGISGLGRGLGGRRARAAEAVAGRPVGRPLPGSAARPGAARRALRRRTSRAGALPRWAVPGALPSWGAALRGPL